MTITKRIPAVPMETIHDQINHDGDSPDENGDNDNSARDTQTPMEPSSYSGKRGTMRRTSLAVARIAIADDPDKIKKLNAKNPRGRVMNQWESWNYIEPHNKKFMEKKAEEDAKSIKSSVVLRYGVGFLIGVAVALVAFTMWALLHLVSKAKFSVIYTLMEVCDRPSLIFAPALFWIFFNVLLTFLGSYLVTYYTPMASGSGGAQIKCYLNGMKFPGLMSMKTLIGKILGVVLAVGGGIMCGKEGPMIHSGSICASVLARGELACGSSTVKPKSLESLRNDQERRDFVAAGMACGVSAAFASPIGGLMFAIEEGASFISRPLTMRMFFSSAVAYFFLNLMMSVAKGSPGDLSNKGLISLGYIENFNYEQFEIFFCIALGVFGGLCGAAYVAINYHVMMFRRRVVTTKVKKVAEAVIVAGFSGLIMFSLIYVLPDCAPIRGFGVHATGKDFNASAHLQGDLTDVDGHDIHRRSADPQSPPALGNHTESPYGNHGHGYVTQALCEYGYESRMAAILLGTPEESIHTMLHAPLDQYSVLPLLALFVVCHLLASLTPGLAVSSGIFIPLLLVGAIYGRIFGIVIMKYIPATGVNISKYCVIGAGCMLGGTVRLTIALAIILIEVTGGIEFGIPIILSLIMAKWTGDFFITGIYEMHIELMGAPILGWDAPRLCDSITASEVMSTPVAVLRCKERLSTIARVLHNPLSHNGFPVVEEYDPDAEHNGFGQLKGFILKSQLVDALHYMGLTDLSDNASGYFDLTDHMDRCPYTVYEDQSLPRIFKIFRLLGLRHLPVINQDYNVVGVLTRVNLARFREETSLSKLKVEELHVVEK